MVEGYGFTGDSARRISETVRQVEGMGQPKHDRPSRDRVGMVPFEFRRFEMLNALEIPDFWEPENSVEVNRLVWDEDEGAYTDLVFDGVDDEARRDPFTVYDFARRFAKEETPEGERGAYGWAIKPFDRQDWEILDMEGQAPQFGKLDGTLSQGGSATVSIWAGDPLAETDEKVTAHDWFLGTGESLAADIKVKIEMISGKWYVTGAAC